MFTKDKQFTLETLVSSTISELAASQVKQLKKNKQKIILKIPRN